MARQRPQDNRAVEFLDCPNDQCCNGFLVADRNQEDFEGAYSNGAGKCKICNGKGVIGKVKPGYEHGCNVAELMFYDEPDRLHNNPFAEGTDEHRGFEDMAYIFLYK